MHALIAKTEKIHPVRPLGQGLRFHQRPEDVVVDDGRADQAVGEHDGEVLPAVHRDEPVLHDFHVLKQLSHQCHVFLKRGADFQVGEPIVKRLRFLGEVALFPKKTHCRTAFPGPALLAGILYQYFLRGGVLSAGSGQIKTALREQAREPLGTSA
jgi:hypothetical protein